MGTTRFGKVARRVMPLLLLSGTAVLVQGSPAAAHANRIIQGNDHADINSSHSSGYVCDNEPDGRYTYVLLIRPGTSPVYRYEYDRGGADGTCDPFSVTANFYTQWRMCEEVAGTDPCTKTEPL